MGLRTGSSTAERGAWPRSLRGTIVAGPTPSRAHDNDCLCLPAASTSHQSEAGKKESPDHHLNPACQPCAEPSSISSFDCRLINARTADNGSAQNGSTNKSAKVVLVPLYHYSPCCAARAEASRPRNRGLETSSGSCRGIAGSRLPP